MEWETNDECLRWTIFSCANVSILMRTVLFSDVIWGVDPAILVSNTLSSGHSVFLPKSRCSEPCDLGAVKVRHHGGVRVIMILLQKMSEGEKCCWVCTWCQVILSPSRIEKRISKPRVMIQLNWFMGMAWTVLICICHFIIIIMTGSRVRGGRVQLPGLRGGQVASHKQVKLLWHWGE